MSQPLAAGSDTTGQWQLLNIETASGNRITLAVNISTAEVRLAGNADASRQLARGAGNAR